MGRAGEGRGRFFTSIQFSESSSGRLADRPLGSVLRLLTSSVLAGTGVTARGDPGADSAGERGAAGPADWEGGKQDQGPTLSVPGPTGLLLAVLAGHELRAIEQLGEVCLCMVHSWRPRQRPLPWFLPPAHLLSHNLDNRTVLQGLQQRPGYRCIRQLDLWWALGHPRDCL